MKTLPALLFVACTLIVLSKPGLAQNTKVYRCGPEGRELSQKPLLKKLGLQRRTQAAVLAEKHRLSGD